MNASKHLLSFPANFACRHRRRREKLLCPLAFSNGRCAVGKADPDVRNMGLDGDGRESSRRFDGCRVSGPGDFFQCDLSAGVYAGVAPGRRASCGRESIRRDEDGRASGRCESFQCGLPEGADGGRLVSGRDDEGLLFG